MIQARKDSGRLEMSLHAGQVETAQVLLVAQAVNTEMARVPGKAASKFGDLFR